MSRDEQYLTQAEELDEARQALTDTAHMVENLAQNLRNATAYNERLEAEVLRLSAAKADLERAAGDEVRGMMRDFEAEISDLERWKAEATAVLVGWEEVADLFPVKLGESKAAAVKAWVLRTSAWDLYERRDPS